MFAKRSTFVIPSAPPSWGEQARELTQKLLANPVLTAVAAGALFLLCALVMILAAANPRAGLPHVRIHLSDASAPPPPGWREALTAELPGAAPVTVAGLELLPGGAGANDQMQGQATITLPGAGGMADHAGQALPQAPFAGLTEPGPSGGLLPIVAQDGRTPAQAYARPFHSNGKPKIALVIGGLGLNAKTTRQAIEQLPAEITLSFVPYSEGLQGWIDLARANGHEVLIEAPMEPNDYPDNDPGPYTLMAQGRPAETIEKLDWVLSRATGYFGVTNYLGSKFLNSDTAMAGFTGDLHQRGLAFIDDGTAVKRGGGILRASADAVIDDQLAGDEIDKQLILLEADATRNGQALGSGFAYPLTLDQVARWATTLAQRGYQLAPASAVTMRR